MEQDSFRIALSDMLRPLTDPEEIQAKATHMLGQYLQVSGALFSEVKHEDDGDYYVIHLDYHAPDVQSIAGRYPTYYFGMPVEELRALVVVDTQTDPILIDQERVSYQNIGVRAFVSVPMIREGYDVASFFVYQSVPRIWTSEEVALIEETAERTWAAVERARAEAALREVQEHLRLMVDSAKDYAIFSLDSTGKVKTWNTGAERVFGYTEPEIVGKHVAVIFTPEDRLEAIPELEMKKASEEGYSENERWHLRKDGSRFFASGMVRPIYDASTTLIGFTKIARDMTDRKLAEERTELLQQLTAELSAQLTPSEMAKVIIRAVQQASGEAMISIFLKSADNQSLERLSSDRVPVASQQRYKQLPLEGAFPPTDAIRAGQVLWIDSQAEYIRRYPHVKDEVIQAPIHAALALPLMLNTHILGCLSLTFQYPKQLSQQEQELLIAIAHLCTQALQRARLFEAEQAALREATLRADRITRLQSVTSKLSQLLTFDEVVQLIVDEAVMALNAITGSLNLLEDEKTFVVTYSVGSKMSPEERTNWRRYPLDPELLAGDAVHRGELIWLESSQAMIDRYPKMARVAELYPGAWITLPLFIKGRTVGIMGFNFGEDRPFDQEEANFIQALAQQCAQAIERSQLHEAELKGRKLLQLQIGFQSVISELGQEALASFDLSLLMHRTVERLAHTLEVEYAQIFEWLPKESSLLLRYGVGWRPGYVGGSKISVRSGAQPSYAMLSHNPVVFKDISAETNFSSITLFADHNVMSGISLIIGDYKKPWGVLGICSTQQRTFTSDEIYLVQTISHILASTLQRIRLETMLRRSNEELRQFAYVASHDLQEPLRTVSSYLQLLDKRYANQLDKDAQEFIGFAVDGAVHMKALISALLEYSRIDINEEELKEFDAQVALENAISNLRLQIEETQALITHDKMPWIRGNFMQIVLLFQNLLSNALKFHSERRPEIHIGVERKESEWQFKVQDNGIGIASNYLERIFIIFQRLHRRDEYPGTGIGLAASKKVIERHGGRIWVESTPGEGTTFYFTIPI